MKEITLTLKVITPLFMGGATMEPEIRSQSIKGIIRFWWRALRSSNDLKKLKEEETKIFGVHFKGSTKSSDFKLTILEKEENRGNDIRNDLNFTWSFDREVRCLKGDNRGIGYIFYSVLNKGYIKPTSTFKIKIQTRDENILKQVLASLWCAIYLGGFGARSKRGGGSLYVSEVDGETFGIDFRVDSNGNSSVDEWVKKNFEKCIEIVGKPKDFCYGYSNLSVVRIIISNGKNDWKEALNNIGTKYHDFRKEKRSLIFENAAFGLPVLHRNGNVLTNKPREISRRASPLIFKVIKYKDNFYWMVVRLAGEFLPNNIVVSFNNNTQKVDYSIIEDFWQSLKRDSQNREILLQLPQSLDNIKRKLKEKGINKIILFGSKARGDFKKNSDIDIAIDKPVPIDFVGNCDIVNINNCDRKIIDKIKKEGFEI